MEVPSSNTHAPLPPGERRIAMSALMCASILASLDTTIANTALPQIAGSLRASEAAVIWVANAYQIAVVATMLPFASLGENIGYKRVYVGGMLLFALASALCGGASELWLLVMARALQGVGAAAMLSVVAAVIRQLYPPSMLGRGLGANALVVAIGFTLGPVAASAVLSVANWHWLFFVNVPIAIPSVVLALRYLPKEGRRINLFEPAPAALCTALLGLPTLGFCMVENGGDARLAVLFAMLAVTCLVALLRLQRHHPAPMLAIDLLRIRSLRLSSLTSICAFTTQSLALVSLPFFLQNSLGVSVVRTGFVLAAWPLVVGLMAAVIAPLSDSGRYSPGALCTAGLIALAAGMCSLALLRGGVGEIGVAARLGLCGIGFGLFQAPNMREIMGQAPAHRSGGASGIVAISRLLGQTIGAALVAQCFHFWHGFGPTMALWTGSCAALLGALFSAMRLRPAVSRPAISS